VPPAERPAAAGRRFSGAELTIPSVLDAQAAERPDQVLLHVDGTDVTYDAMRRRSTAAAEGLRRLGVGPGERVAIVMETSPEWVVLWFALSRLGAVVVPVNTAYRGEFLAHQLRDSGTVAVATTPALVDRVAAVAAEVPTLRAVLLGAPRAGTADGAGPPHGGAPGDGGVAWPAAGPAVLALEQVLDGGDGLGGDGPRSGEEWPPARHDEVGAIFYTSGTTGPSKGALATQHYLLSAAQAMLDCWQLEPGEAVYAPLPLFHLSAVGSVLGPLLAGGTGVIDRAFSVHATWDRVRRHRAVGLLGAGPMVTMLWNQSPEGPGDGPFRFLSAAPVPGDLYRQLEERWHCRIVTCYGLSEAFPLTYAGVGDDNPPGASGKPNPDFEVAILDDDDISVPSGEVGEICCRPRRPHVMFEGYEGRPEATLAQLATLWFHTGDLGRFDEDGNLYYVDRRKDAMRRRGENISSFEVEQALLAHPAVAEVAAIGVPSPLGEDDVMVCLVARPDVPLEMTALMDFCCERLPYFAVPRYVDVRTSLPKNAVGRVLKHELRAEGVRPGAWDREAAGYVVRR
jgi:crotonobetaine/carnitine-CoA ligase